MSELMNIGCRAFADAEDLVAEVAVGGLALDYYVEESNFGQPSIAPKVPSWWNAMLHIYWNGLTGLLSSD